MKVVTWNVNSINVRLGRLKNLIRREDPDIVCLQELKCTDDKFPADELEKLGYFSSYWGQKTYNGVAILSKEKPSKIWKGFDSKTNEESRLIAIRLSHLTVICVYVPNGQEVGSEKYQFKLNWFKKLNHFLESHFDLNTPLLVCGDFNVAPTDQDVYDPSVWRDKILFSTPEKTALNSLLNLGFLDCYRQLHPREKAFTWWDYRNVSFLKDHGLRIDFILGTDSIIQKAEDAYVDRNERKGTQPSDHAPVIGVFTD